MLYNQFNQKKHEKDCSHVTSIIYNDNNKAIKSQLQVMPARAKGIKKTSHINHANDMMMLCMKYHKANS